jgi:hypothetical protein
MGIVHSSYKRAYVTLIRQWPAKVLLGYMHERIGNELRRGVYSGRSSRLSISGLSCRTILNKEGRTSIRPL